MRKTEGKSTYSVRRTHFPLSILGMTLTVLLVIAGIHFGILSFLDYYVQSHLNKVLIVITYWICVSITFTLFIMRQMRETYEIPMQQLAKAANRVAHGDFSVYVAPLHTNDRLDLDLNGKY